MTQKIRLFRGIVVIGIFLSLFACTLGPDYVKPPVETPPAFKESTEWKTAKPGDIELTEKWWELFGDAALNELEESVSVSNQEVALAAARYNEARALADASRAGLYPTLTGGASASRTRESANTVRGKGATVSDFLLPVNLTWELDVWGRIRRSIEAGKANLQASAADLAAIRLSMQAELAADYFQLCTLDADKAFLEKSIAHFQKSLTMTQNRYEAGVVSRADVLQAENLLKNTQASLVEIGVQRAQLEHAVALLIGKPAPSLSLPAKPLTATPPDIPPVLPSELLERRPDIASAERQMAAANAQIGIQKAAYFPTIKLGATIGLEASEITRWLSWPSRFWSVGPAISESVFDGGLRKAQTDQALAAFDASVASYRQTVLTAFKETEDQLAALKILAEENKIQDEAVALSGKTVSVTLNQYEAGVVGYLNVLSAQNTELSQKRTAIGIQGRRLNAAVLLIKALGGGWNTSKIF